MKLLVKQSSANISLQEGAQFLSSGTVGMYATATADASGNASGSLASIGYGRASASAIIEIQKDVVIDAAAAVIVAATGSATADIGASAAREGYIAGTLNSTQPVSLAIGVADAHVTSHVTVAQGASIMAGKTANVAAAGEIGAAATGEAGLDDEGVAGLGFGIEVSKADIHTIVNGNITARAEDGYTVKVEIDPLVAKSDYTSDQTVAGLKKGKTVELTADVNDDLPAGTVMEYIGASVADTVALATQNYADVSLWEKSTPALGYVDYDTDRIFFGDVALVTEDVIDYTNRRGTSIGGLVDNTSYYVIADLDDPGYFWLAETETQAIRASLGYLTTNVVPLYELGGELATANNERPFDSTDVDAEANTIALQRVATVNNTFELGQAVVFHAPSVEFTSGNVANSTIYIPGHGFATGDAVTYDGVGLPANPPSGALKDGDTYYVIFINEDHIKLSATPNGASLALTPDKSTAGKAAVVHTLTRAIDGLVDGGTYYVAASTGQTNLQGDTRFTETQVIGLSESENEARGGVLIDIGAVTGSGYTLSAKHVLDSGFATGIGVVATLDAENSASATGRRARR